MTKRTIIVGIVAMLAVAAWPAQAEIYTLTLKNGTTFESRYQPREAAWDANVVLLTNDIGLDMALPLEDIAEMSILSETKGFGSVLDAVTLDLGVMPNDLPTEDGLPKENAASESPFDRMMSQDYDQQQFVNPSDAGGGIPVFGVGESGTGVIGSNPVTSGRGRGRGRN